MDITHNWDAWIGTDEAGKGDYFGPLVVAAVYVDAAGIRETLATAGVADGKTLSPRRIRHLAELMRCGYEQNIAVVERMPADYNALYDDFRRRGQNLNHLLASLHAEAIDTLVDRVGAKHVLVDRFSKNDLITEQLIQRVRGKSHGRRAFAASRACEFSNRASLGVEIVQVPKAERDIAVAAASIIARDVFIDRLAWLSEKYEIRLPRGAYRVVDAGREFVRLHGDQALGDVAKLHFRLTDAVRAL